MPSREGFWSWILDFGPTVREVTSNMQAICVCVGLTWPLLLGLLLAGRRCGHVGAWKSWGHHCPRNKMPPVLWGDVWRQLACKMGGEVPRSPEAKVAIKSAGVM